MISPQLRLVAVQHHELFCPTCGHEHRQSIVVLSPGQAHATPGQLTICARCNEPRRFPEHPDARFFTEASVLDRDAGVLPVLRQAVKR